MLTCSKVTHLPATRTMAHWRSDYVQIVTKYVTTRVKKEFWEEYCDVDLFSNGKKK